MDQLEKLVAIEDIKNLKARYFQYCDGKTWDKFEALFVPDCVFESFDYGESKSTGTRAFVEFSEKYLADCLSIHHAYTPDIVITSPTTATGLWVMDDTLLWEKPGTKGDPLGGYKRIFGRGHYHETYVKGDDGKWRIATWKLTRVKLEREK